MAILDTVPGIKVTVRVGGADCVEYDDPEPAGPPQGLPCPTSTKYIEAVTGAEFAIHYAVGPGYAWGHHWNQALNLRIHIDGKFFDNPLATPGSAEGLRVGTCTRSDLGTWFFQKPMFFPVRTVDDTAKDRLKKDQQLAKDLGLITVEVYRVTLHSSTFWGRGRHTNFEDASHELAEKAMKGKEISHGTVLSPGQRIPEPAPSNVMYLHEDNGPIAAFHFRYRSREALKRELVIPRSPPRSPTMPPGFEYLSKAEINRLAKEKFRDLMAGVKIKREAKWEAKREPGESFDLTRDDPWPRAAKKTTRVKVIDLTGD